eukprot:TRINITY_DN7640_c0_g1_i1.p1 TRINITY_DN7640_c0_g1~~TRINITY_DN7640_c0_g1_i1.p1  ORF type:complete len:711 (-),score=128.41 TRINITY_DN7640_c0_g1_i1:354-2486(-)
MLLTRRAKIREALQRSSFLQELKPDAVAIGVQNSDKVGFLMKEGGHYKTWRRRFFVVSKAEHLVYYSESPQNLGCLGIIVLEDCAVREVIMVGENRPFLFEIHRRDDRSFMSSNHRTYRLQATSYEDMLSWVDVINKAILNESPSTQRQRIHAGRLFVKLHNAQNCLQQADGSQIHPTSTLCIAGQDFPQHKHTTMRTSGWNPSWEEEFSFDIESRVSSLQIVIQDRVGPESRLLGMVDLKICDNFASEVKLKEYQLMSGETGEPVSGSILISAYYLDQSFLREIHAPKYNALLEELLNPSADVLHILFHTIKTCTPSLGTALVRIFDSNKRIIPLLKWAVASETNTSSQPKRLFAINSLAGHIFREFFFAYGLDFARTTFASAFDEIQRKYLETMSYCFEEEKYDQSIKADDVVQLCNILVDAFQRSLDLIPGPIREACSLVHFIVSQVFPGAGALLVAKLITNYFLSPLLLDPAGSGLYHGPIPPKQLLCLPLVASIWQSMATQDAYPQDELFHDEISAYISSTKQRMQDAFHEFAVMLIDPPKGEEISYDKSALLKEMHLIHHLLVKYRSEIELFSLSMMHGSSTSIKSRNTSSTSFASSSSTSHSSKRPSLVVNSVDWNRGCTIPTCICKVFSGSSSASALSKCSTCGHPLSAHSGTASPSPVRSKSLVSMQPRTIRSSMMVNAIPEGRELSSAFDIHALLEKLDT